MTEKEFNIDPLKKYNILEVGRAVVKEEYRSGIVIMLLWKAVITYAVENNIDYMIGTASFQGVDPKPYADAFTYLGDKFLSPEDIRCEVNKESYFPLKQIDSYDSLEAKKQLGFSQQIEYNFEKIHGENSEKAYKVMKRIFNLSGDELSKIGFKVEHVNGTTSIPFTLDMATDEEREMVELGFMSEEDLKSQYGAGKGAFVSKVAATGLSKGYSNGAIETGQTLADYQEEVSTEEDIFDIFDM